MIIALGEKVWGFAGDYRGSDHPHRPLDDDG